MYIAIFGEVGIFGLIMFIVPMFYFTFIVPFVDDTVESLLVGAISFAMLAAGVVETHDIFGANVGVFFIVLAYSGFLKQRLALSDTTSALP